MPNANLIKAFSSSLSAEDYEGLFEEFSKSIETRIEAREACLKELTSNPKNTHARLILARLYYLDEYFEFGIRELTQLKKYCNLDSLKRLVDSFGAFGADFLDAYCPSLNDEEVEAFSLKEEVTEKSKSLSDGSTGLSKISSAEEFETEEEFETIAEIDFDSGFMDVIDDLDEEIE